MPVVALLAQSFIFNAIDLTDHSKGAQWAAEAAALDATAMGDLWTKNTGGLKSGTVNATLLDDFAASSVDATIWAAFSTGTAVAVASKPTAAAISATNPEYQVNVLPTQWNMGGSLGELAAKSLTWPMTGALVRDITP